MSTTASPVCGQPNNATTEGMVIERLDRLPSSKTLWRVVVLLSLGGFFEFYELFSTLPPTSCQASSRQAS